MARRLLDRQDDYLRFATNLAVPPDNNGSERDIRMIKLRQSAHSRCTTVLHDTKLVIHHGQARPANLRKPSSCSPRGDQGCPHNLTSYEFRLCSMVHKHILHRPTTVDNMAETFWPDGEIDSGNPAHDVSSLGFAGRSHSSCGNSHSRAVGGGTVPGSSLRRLRIPRLVNDLLLLFNGWDT
ncbi:transposase [Nocardia sp. NBC_01009]|uniref:IS66 family transposase n=1 Tax=Nocardia sp. NBC_01009 TaxID=2975996 RepID=UPI0038646327